MGRVFFLLAALWAPAVVTFGVASPAPTTSCTCCPSVCHCPPHQDGQGFSQPTCAVNPIPDGALPEKAFEFRCVSVSVALPPSGQWAVNFRLFVLPNLQVGVERPPSHLLALASTLILS